MKDKVLLKYFFENEIQDIENKIWFNNMSDVLKLTIEHLYNEMSVFWSITAKIESESSYPNSALISSILNNLFIKYFLDKYLKDKDIYWEDEQNDNIMNFYSFLLEISNKIDLISITNNFEDSKNDLIDFIDNYFKEIIPSDEIFNIHILNQKDIEEFLKATNWNENINELELFPDIVKSIIFNLLFQSVKAKLIIYKIVLDYIPYNQVWYKDKIIQDIINLLTQSNNE